MRIAYLTGTFPSVTHTFITREIRGLRALGLDVRTFAIRPAPTSDLVSESNRAAASETVTILPLDKSALIRGHARAIADRPRAYLETLVLAMRLGGAGARNKLWQLFYFAESILVLGHTRALGIGHVHVHFGSGAATAALLGAHYDPGRLSWSFTMHGPDDFWDVAGLALAEKVRRATFVACVSDYCRSQLMTLVEPDHWPKLQIVHCGVEPAHYDPAATSARDGRLRILCVGRLVRHKGQEVLIEAVAELRRRGIAVSLSLIGDGPERQRLERVCARLGLQDAVSFEGLMAEERIRDWHAGADVFCLPSFAEGVPVVLMEAMASGLPVVSTRITGIPELVDDGRNGILVRPGRVDELAGALHRLACDPDLRRAYGAAGRAKVCEEYDISQSVERLHVLFTRGRST